MQNKHVMNTDTIKIVIILCGLAHILLCAASLYIPKALKWETHLSKLQPLLRQMFWTYAGYILAINFCFGVLSVFGSSEMLNGSFLAKGITLFIGAYWFVRVIIQFFYFDKSEAPKGILFVIAEVALVAMFLMFTISYFAAFIINLEWI